MAASPQNPKRSSNITLGVREQPVASSTTPEVTVPPPLSASSTSPRATMIISPLSTPTITLEGYLSKQAEKGRGKGWKKRWFSANDLDFKMFYYKPSFGTSNYDQVAGNIDLSIASEVKPTKNKSGFEIITSTRRWHLRATSEEQLTYWVNGLTQILSKKSSLPSSTGLVLAAPAAVSLPILAATTTQETAIVGLQPTPPQPQFISLSSSTSALPSLPSTQSSSAQNSPQSSIIIGSDQKHSSQELKPGDADALRQAPTSTTPKRDGSDKAPGGIRLSIPGAFMEGYLQKQGEKGLVKSWKKRYFVAKGSKMWYYKQTISSSGYDQRAGFIDLAAVNKIEQASGGKDKFQFQIHSASRTWFLMGSCDEDVQYWLTGLTTMLASIAQQPTSTENVRSTMVNRSTSDTSWSRSAMTGAKQDAEFQRIVQRVNELEKLNAEKDKAIENLKEKSTKMEDKMILWNRIAFLNWAEATDLDKRLADAEKAKETSADDEPYLKQIRLLKKQLNEKTFNCQVLESEVEKLNGEIRTLKGSLQHATITSGLIVSSASSSLSPSPTPTPGRPLSESMPLSQSNTVGINANASSPNLMSLASDSI